MIKKVPNIFSEILFNLYVSAQYKKDVFKHIHLNYPVVKHIYKKPWKLLCDRIHIRKIYRSSFNIYLQVFKIVFFNPKDKYLFALKINFFNFVAKIITEKALITNIFTRSNYKVVADIVLGKENMELICLCHISKINFNNKKQYIYIFEE